MHKHNQIILFLIVFFCIFLLTACSGSDNESIEESELPEVIEEENVQEPEIIGIYNPLTGLHVSKTQNITAVMVDNHSFARPQSGLAQADIIYEIEAEGSITRLMALFYGDPPEFVGPVRSARPYYLQIAKEWDAYYVHVGGCNDSFAKIVEWKIRDIDDTKGHSGFFLDNTRRRPHSTYLNFEKALLGKADNGIFKDWGFIETPDEYEGYTEVSFSYNGSNRVSYKWNDEEKVYFRYINNAVHVDRLGGQLKANNIIIQYANHRNLNTVLDHIWVDVIGNGKSEYFLGGQYFQGTWEKKNITAPTMFYDEHGNHIKLVEGQTWIQVLRPTIEILKL